MDIQAEYSRYLKMIRAGRTDTPSSSGLPGLRIAVMADNAVQQVCLVLRAAASETGFSPTIWAADYGTMAQQALEPSSELYKFRPDAVYVSFAVQKYRDRFYDCASQEGRGRLHQQYLEEVLGVIDAIVAKGLTVVVTNFAAPIERMFGNYGALTPHSLYGSVGEYNHVLLRAIRERSGVLLHDVAYLAGTAGLANFFDERAWATSKYACAAHCLPELCLSFVRLVAAKKGRITKAIILDLDNTIWGGIIGDDGIDGIALGGDAYGEAFQQFQRYIRSLKDRGYVLAVCSKNTEEIALDAFRNHPEMILKDSDIAVFVANWDDKATNIERIAKTLNLGLDSFVFVDDSAFERGLVRAALPAVKVPEMPEDVADYVATLEAGGYFEATEFTDEDRGRSQSYRAEIERSHEQVRFASLDDYLTSLEMRIDCGPFRDDDLPRISQLIQRSNQFNLRSQRLTQAQCEKFKAEGLTVAARVSDRFGDYGLISAICCEIHPEELFVSELVMSCRVLKRGVEEYLMNHLFSECLRLGRAGIRGEYIPTAKNSLVRDFYKSFGFKLVDGDQNRQVWHLEAINYLPRQTFFR